MLDLAWTSTPQKSHFVDLLNAAAHRYGKDANIDKTLRHRKI